MGLSGTRGCGERRGSGSSCEKACSCSSPPSSTPPQEHGDSLSNGLGIDCPPSLGQAAGKLHQRQIKTKSIYSATDHFVKNIAQYRTSNRGMWGRKAASCVVKSYPKQLLKTSRAHAVAKLSTTGSAYRWGFLCPGDLPP